MAMVNIDNTQ